MKELLKTDAAKDTANFFLQTAVALALIGLVFYCVWGVMNEWIKADSAVVGSAFTMFIVLVNFCFPNSIGAQRQQDTINTLATSASAPISTTTTTTTEKLDVRVPDPETVGDTSPGQPDVGPGPVAGGTAGSEFAPGNANADPSASSSDKPPPPGEIL